MHNTVARAGAAPRPQRPARLSVTATAEHTTVAVVGDLDLTVTGQLAARLEEELHLSPPMLIIDIRGVGFCSVRGISVLQEATAAARAARIDAAIIADSRAAQRPIHVLQLEHVLPLHRTLADATEWLAIHSRAGVAPF
ncbi:STAS domain-containing protein [Amycolatopsis sp. cmx-8-4]|uniref:STAS domain-containing protein n=1 Tax=Amycolatopsis sp. cmx-8-4 TaxID=2790947 RepID=UPI00397E0D09